MANDQYIPDAGAGATLGDVCGEGNGGYGIYGPRFALEGGKLGLGVAEETVVVVEVGALGALLAMAEVDRKANGRRLSPFFEWCALPWAATSSAGGEGRAGKASLLCALKVVFEALDFDDAMDCDLLRCCCLSDRLFCDK